jgi:hypothetical protein
MQDSQYQISSNSLIIFGNEADTTSNSYDNIKQFSKNIQWTKRLYSYFTKANDWQTSPVGRPTETYRCLPSIHTIKQSAVFHPRAKSLTAVQWNGLSVIFWNDSRVFLSAPGRGCSPQLLKHFLNATVRHMIRAFGMPVKQERPCIHENGAIRTTSLKRRKFAPYRCGYRTRRCYQYQSPQFISLTNFQRVKTFLPFCKTMKVHYKRSPFDPALC